MTTPAVAAITSAKYVLLTTFKRDGSAVATPVWAVADGTAILVWTSRETGKVKRIRRSGEITVAPCTMRGKQTGNTITGTATLLDTPGTIRVQKLIAEKYGWIDRFLVRRMIRKQGQDAAVGIRVDLGTARTT